MEKQESLERFFSGMQSLTMTDKACLKQWGKVGEVMGDKKLLFRGRKNFGYARLGLF